jgi:GntR family transcriptional regulator/MocR family aminotransferase
MGKITPQILLTFLHVRKNNKETIHDQLYEQLKQAIFEGMLLPGDRMPSSRELGRELGVSRNSVLQVFERLLIEGFFEAQTGSGTFISSNVSQFFRNRKLPTSNAETRSESLKPNETFGLNQVFRGQESAAEPVLPFQQSVPLISQFPFGIWARISAAVNRSMPGLHLGYDDAQGYFPLRKAIAGHLRISRSIKCDPDHILIVNGTRQALHLAVEILVNPGDLCWMEDPGYPGATSAMQRFGAQICPVPIKNDGMDLEYAMRHYPQARLAYVTPSHQFPMGTTMPLSDRIDLLNWSRDHQMWIIEDDYDSEFRYNSRPIPALQGIAGYGNVIYSGTFSKVLLPALRLGYMVFPDTAMARRFTAGKSVIDGQNNIITQAIVAEFIRQGHFSRHIRRMRLQYKKKQDDLVGLLLLHLKGKLTPVPVEAGMHLIAWLPADMDAGFIAGEAKKQGVVVHAINQFCLKADHLNGLILGFAGFTFKEMENAVLTLKNVLDNYA